jgi:hypothetical protein
MLTEDYFQSGPCSRGHRPDSADASRTAYAGHCVASEGGGGGPTPSLSARAVAVQKPLQGTLAPIRPSS